MSKKEYSKLEADDFGMELVAQTFNFILFNHYHLLSLSLCKVFPRSVGLFLFQAGETN